MLIVWKENFAIDRGVIDADHKFLVGGLNDIIAKLNNGAQAGEFRRLTQHVRYFAELHFKREERLQEQCGYPGLAEHREEHRLLLRGLDAFLAAFAALPADATLADAREAKSFLYRWILGHILQSDGRLKPYVAAIDTSREPPLARAVA